MITILNRCAKQKTFMCNRPQKRKNYQKKVLFTFPDLPLFPKISSQTHFIFHSLLSKEAVTTGPGKWARMRRAECKGVRERYGGYVVKVFSPCYHIPAFPPFFRPCLSDLNVCSTLSKATDPSAGDLCQVMHYDPSREMATVRMIPRIDIQAIVENTPRPCVPFLPEEAASPRPPPPPLRSVPIQPRWSSPTASGGGGHSDRIRPLLSGGSTALHFRCE